MARLRLPAVALLALALALAACGDDDGAAPGGGGQDADGRLRVVTTVAPLTNIVENVGGDRIALRGIVPEGTNSHTFEPAPSDAKLLAAADLIVINGLNLEKPTLKLARANMKDGATILRLGDETIDAGEYIFDFSFPESEGDPNPHLWMNPQYAMSYARLVADELERLDPDNAEYYGGNLEAYLDRLDELDGAIREALETIPAGNRRLLTYHDSWAYFARRYGLEVIGAVQPSDFSEPSAREVARVIDQIRQQKVPAVFGSEVFPSQILKQIASETGARYVDELRDDDLPGDPGDDRHSYIGLMLVNMEVMIPALGGKVEPLARIDPADLAAGGGQYAR